MKSLIKPELKLISSVVEFESLKNDWNALYAKSNRSTVFSSWEWMFTWWEVFNDQYKRELFILCLYQDEKLIGLAPFQIITFSPKTLILQGKTLCFIGTGDARKDNIITQYLDFLVLPGKESMMIDAVSEYLISSRNKWDFADMEFLLKDALILDCFKTKDSRVSRKKLEYGVRFFIPKMDDFEQHLDQMAHRWQKMLAKKSRIIARDGSVTITSTEESEPIEIALKRLADMNCSRWSDRTKRFVFDSPRFYKFHKKILHRLVPQKRAYIRTLSLNNEPIATYYYFTDKGQIHYYQSGFNTKYGNRYSPLFLLICNEIGLAIEKKQMFDFMYTDSTDSYKRDQYAATYEPMYRLHWSIHPVRFLIFNCIKAIQVKAIYLIEKLKKSR